MAPIRYAIGRTVTAAEVANFEAGDFEEFCTVALSQGARARKKDGPYFCAAMKSGKRAKENAEPLAVLALDFDALRDEAELARLMDEAQAWRAFGYTTASHDPAAGKVKARLLFELDRPATAEEYPRVARAVTAELARRTGIALEADAAVMKIEQPIFTLRAGALKWEHYDGPPVCVDKAARINGAAKPKQRESAEPAAELIPAGKRNQTLTAIAGALRRRGLSPAAIEAAVLAENARCAPPLPEAEARRIAASVARYQPGHLPYLERGWGTAEAAPIPVPAPLTAAAILGMQFKPLSWCVPDILPEGIFILAARPKIGKSWLALQIGLAVGEGRDVLGRHATRGEVLYLALEDNARRLRSRLIKLNAGGAATIEFATEWPRADQGGVEALLAWCEAHPAVRLVIVDTLQRIRPRRSSRGGDLYGEDYEAMGSFKVLVERHRATVLVVHHVRKSEAEDPMDLISGTLGLGGAADGVIVLKRDRGQERAELHLMGRDVISEGAFVVEFKRASCTWHMVGDVADVGASEAQSEILALLRTAAEPMTAREIAEELGKARSGVRRLLCALKTSGKVQQDAKRRYMRAPEQGEQASILPENRANA